MESPKINLYRGKAKFPPNQIHNRDMNYSDSFTNLPSLITNSTPDYLKPKTATKFSNNTEFTSSVQEFLKQSTEIQDEIRKLSEICQQISPKFVNGKEIEIPEKPNWEKVNEIVSACNLTPLILEEDSVNHQSLIDTFLEAIYEYSAQLGISEQARNEANGFEKTLRELTERNSYLEKKLEKTRPRKNIEAEVKELEKISKSMENKFRRMKASLKEKDNIIKDLNLSARRPEKAMISIDSFEISDRAKEIFTIYIGREYRENSESDHKVLSIIEMYEKNKSNFETDCQDQNELQVILDELETPSTNEALSAIARLKQEVISFSDTEKFIQDLYCELFLRPLHKNSVKSEELYKDILKEVVEFKDSSRALEVFKQEVVNSVQCKDINEDELMEKLKVVGYFRKLFQIDQEEDEFKVIHDIYFFVHEIKIFLQQARAILRKDSISLSMLLEEITQCLSRN